MIISLISTIKNSDMTDKLNTININNNLLSVESQFQEIVNDYTFVNPNIGKMYGNRIVFKTTFSDSLLFKLENSFNLISGCLLRIQALIKRNYIGRFQSEMKDAFYEEIISLMKSIDSIAINTESNGIKLLNGQRKNIILTNNNSDNNFVAIGEEVFGNFAIKALNLLNENWSVENLFKYISKDYDRAMSDLDSALKYINERINAIKDCREQINKKTINNSIRKISKKEEDTKLLDIQIEIMKNTKKSLLTAVGKDLSYNVVFGQP